MGRRSANQGPQCVQAVVLAGTLLITTLAIDSFAGRYDEAMERTKRAIMQSLPLIC